MATPPVSLLDYNLLVLSMHEQQEERRDGEEDAIYDAKCKRRLQHRAFFVEIVAKRRVAVEATGAETDIEGAIGREVRAIGVGNAAQVVDSCDEGSYKAYVDEADKVGGAAGGFATEEREQAPCNGEGGDYEKDSGGVLAGIQKACQKIGSVGTHST